MLEILWLLSREEVQNPRINRAIDMLLSKQNPDGTWNLEKSISTVVSIGSKGSPNLWITERAKKVIQAFENIR